METQASPSNKLQKAWAWFMSLQWWGKGMIVLGLIVVFSIIGNISEGGSAHFSDISPKDGFATTGTGVTITGKVSNLGKGKVLVNEHTVEVDANGQFTYTLALKEGENDISVVGRKGFSAATETIVVKKNLTPEEAAKKEADKVKAEAQKAADEKAQKEAADKAVADKSKSQYDSLPGVGTTVKSDDLEFTVQKVERHASVGNKYSKADANGEFVVVFLKVKNTASSPQMFDGSTMRIKDSKDREFSKSNEGDVAYSLGNGGKLNFFLEQMQPDLEKSGVVVFDVPKGAEGLTLKLPSGVFSETKYIRL